MFEAALLVGDTRAAAPLDWRLGELTVLHPPLDDGSQPAGPAPRTMELLSSPLPEIVHQHQPPTKRAPAVVSLLATAGCVAPLGLLLVLLGRVGANVKVRQAAGWPAGAWMGA